MSKLKELIAQKLLLELQIADARKIESVDAIARALAIINDYELTAADLFPTAKTKIRAVYGAKVAPKFRDPVSGSVWSGRGKEPVWIAGKDRSEFAIVA